MVHNAPLLVLARDVNQPGSVYPEFKEILQNTVNEPLKFYVGIRIADRKSALRGIEVASSGLTFEQLKVLKAKYALIRDRIIDGTEVPTVNLALNPLDPVSWNISGVKNHGVLMLAEKGLVLRMPKLLTEDRVKGVYQTILIEWVAEALTISRRNPAGLPNIRVEVMTGGRIDSITSRKHIDGIVVAAPHGSFDPHTGDLLQEISYRTGLAAVMTKGFTPTEYGGSRVNVNRPTEKRYPRDRVEAERGTERAEQVYERFRETVLKVAQGPLKLYFELHENGSERNLDVATHGISAAETQAIKTAYRAIRDRRLGAFGREPKIDLLIEPVDKVTFQALVAKEQGILRLVERSLHIELPGRRMLNDAGTRRAYADVLIELIEQLAADKSSPLVSAAMIGAAGPNP
ncbi:MAG: hypothetical protein ACREQO_11365 [Candidatus Binatia bacterium]